MEGDNEPDIVDWGRMGGMSGMQVPALWRW